MVAVAKPVAEAGRRSTARRFWTKYGTGIVFVLPALLIYALFMVYPFLQTILFSFTDWNGATATRTFVGLANYAEMLRDPLLWSALGHNLIWVVLGTVCPIAIGLLLAVLLWGQPRGFTLFRTFYFMPHILSPVVVAIVWSWIYNPIFGILNRALDGVGLKWISRGWLGDPSTALYAVLAAAIWAEVGFCFVVFLAGLQNVNREVLEAAMIDGAGAWRRFWNVIVPELGNVITVVTAIVLIGGFSVFDLVFVMTNGGPANATQVIATYTYEQAFTQNRVGYGATLSIVMTFLALVSSIVFIRLRERE